MTRTDFEFLAQFENNYICALNHNYTRNIPSSDIDRMLQIYEKEKKVKYVLCKHCSSSILAFVKIIGKMYNEEKDRRNNVEINKKQNAKNTDSKPKEVKQGRKRK